MAANLRIDNSLNEATVIILHRGCSLCSLPGASPLSLMRPGVPAPWLSSYPTLRAPAPRPRPPRPCRLGGGTSDLPRLMSRPAATNARAAAAGPGRLIKATWAASDPGGRAGPRLPGSLPAAGRSHPPQAAVLDGACPPSFAARLRGAGAGQRGGRNLVLAYRVQKGFWHV